MGWLDQFEQHPWYRWVWDRPLFGRRPLTHSARAILGRWPGINLYGCACVALGLWLGGWGAWPSIAAAVGLFVGAIVFGHLWV